MRKRVVGLLLGSSLGLGLAFAATQLVLQDERVIDGVDVRRDGNQYVVVLENGQTIVIPIELVKEVRLEQEAPPPPDDDESRWDPGTGVTRSKPRDLGASQPEGATGGVVRSGPRNLAGDPVHQPSTREQLEVLGEPAEFQANIIDPTWRPESDWDMNPHTQNNFAPSRWAEDIVDNRWEPESDWDNNPQKQNNFAPSKWAKSVVDHSWQPTDGFKR